MLRKRQAQKVPTVFLGYFRKHRLNVLVKNLYTAAPEIPFLMRRVRLKIGELYAPFLRVLFRKHQNLRKKISIVDLSLLNETLAVRLRGHAKRMIRISDDAKFKYEKLDMSQLLEKQSQLLRQLISEQQSSLKTQSQQILEQERARIQEKYKSKNQKRARK